MRRPTSSLLLLLAIGGAASPDTSRRKRVWFDARGVVLVVTIRTSLHSPCTVAWSPDSRRFAVGGSNGVKLYEVVTWRELAPVGIDVTNWVAFDREGRLAVGGDPGVKLYDRDGARLLRDFATSSSVYGVAFSPDARQVVAHVADNSIRVWRVENGDEVGALKCDASEQGCTVAVSRDGRLLAYSVGTREVAIASLDPPKELRRWEADAAGVCSVDFSPDGRLLATTGHDMEVRLWDVSTGAARTRFRGHRRNPFGVAFSPDGETLASNSIGGEVILWNVRCGTFIRRLQGDTPAVEYPLSGVAFSPDGRRLAATQPDGSLLVWGRK